MAEFFRNFPLVGYNFGDETTPAIFQDISAYIKIIDDIKDDIAFYTTVYIQDYDRPDNFSFKLYGTTEFYWTFYYLNDDIRESGWPLPQQDLLPKAKKDYPNIVVETTGDISKSFLPGHVAKSATTQGIVKKRYLDLGQIVIAAPVNFNIEEGLLPLVNGEQIGSDQIAIKKSVEQYNSVHHYEDASKNYVDIGLVPSGNGDAAAYPSLSGKTPITYFDRILAKNDSLREIKCLKPDVAVQVKSEFNKLLRG
jgi:hypothetical protein